MDEGEEVGRWVGKKEGSGSKRLEERIQDWRKKTLTKEGRRYLEISIKIVMTDGKLGRKRESLEERRKLVLKKDLRKVYR